MCIVIGAQLAHVEDRRRASDELAHAEARAEIAEAIVLRQAARLRERDAQIAECGGVVFDLQQRAAVRRVTRKAR
jgi:hypothetical protein